MLVTLISTAEPAGPELVAALGEQATVQVHDPPRTPGASESQEIASALGAFESALIADRPDAVLVAGADPRALAAALAAAKLDLPIGRLGAGDELAGEPSPGSAAELPSGYGRLVDRLATRLFCSSESERAALGDLGLGDRAVLVGAEAEGLVSAIAVWLDQL